MGSLDLLPWVLRPGCSVGCLIGVSVCWRVYVRLSAAVRLFAKDGEGGLEEAGCVGGWRFGYGVGEDWTC